MGVKLGEGAFGAVRECQYLVTNETRAVKMYQKNKLNSHTKRKAVDREIYIMSKLKH